MRTLVAIALAVLVSSRAHADGIGIVVLGEPTLQKPVTAMVQGWLKEHGLTVVPAAFDADAQTTFANCFVIEDLSCARGVFEQRAKGDSLIYARVDLQPGKKGARKLVLTGYWFVKEHDAVADKRNCAPCGNKQLSVAITAMLGTLSKSSGLDKGRLKLDSKPSGLVVMLDGIKIGVTPIEEDLGAGPHQIELVKDGKVVAEKAITVEAGARDEIVVPIQQEPPPPGPPAPPPPPKVVHDVKVVKQVEVVTVTKSSRALPVALMLTGVAGAATGGVFLYYGAKSGANEPWVYPNATRNGEIIGGIGGGMLVLGTILFFTTGHATSSAPSAQLTPGGATLGWAGSF